MPETLLLIEDEMAAASRLECHCRDLGWRVKRAGNLQQAEQVLRSGGTAPLVVLADLSLPDGNALDLMERLRGAGAICEWIFLAGDGSVPDSVRALQLGAFELLEKPRSLERLDLLIAGAARSASAQRRLRQRTEARSRRYSPAAFIGRSRAAGAVRDMLARLADVPFKAVILTGETGTGKGLAARILHHSGNRSEAPLVQINCAALPAELLESEVYGHEAGAFTGARARHRGVFERADGGTLFLDEIAEMKPDLQAKLLGTIDEQKLQRVGGEHEIHVDVQVIAATNREPERAIADGILREDLYHRLSVFRIDLPPLREHLDDLDDLVPELIAEFNAAAGRNVRVVPDAVMRQLRAHSWPGNVRELRNVLERCVLCAENEVIPHEWLRLHSDDGPPRSVPPRGLVSSGDALVLPLDGSMSLEAMDRKIIETALARQDFNVTATARSLGTTRETLRYRIRKYGIELPRRRA